MDLDRQQIETWAHAGESEAQEFKRSTSEQRSAAQSLYAMLNHRGGRVLFGVTDDKRVIGQDVSDRTIQELVREIAAIEPAPDPMIDMVEVERGQKVIVVTVPQGRTRPYSYKGTPYRRVGNTNQVMSGEESQRMLLERLHAEQRWENRVAEGWTLADLDTAEITRTLDEAIRRGRVENLGVREPESILQALGLMEEGRLLRAAVVLFGRAERLEARTPQCLLRAARFRGITKAEFLDNKQFHGNAFYLFQQAQKFMLEHLPIAGRFVTEQFERIDEPLYPPLALREALANAICHRDYSIGGGAIDVAIYDDRLEISSAGSLHFGLTVEMLFRQHASRPWNPLIARVFYRRGIIEEWGRGIEKIVELTQQAGLPKPDIEDLADTVTVRFRPSWYVPPQRVAWDLSDRQQEILGVLSGQKRGIPLRSIKAALPASKEWEIKNDLATLKVLGLVKSSGRGQGSAWSIVQNSKELQRTPKNSKGLQRNRRYELRNACFAAPKAPRSFFFSREARLLCLNVRGTWKLPRCSKELQRLL